MKQHYTDAVVGDLAITNARIRTGDPRRPMAHSVCIRNGRVDSIDDPSPPGLTPLDAHGRTLLPGLIDAHLHLLNGGLSLQQLDLSAVRSREQFEAAIARRHAELPGGQWLIGHRWSSENWGGDDPDKSWLQPAGDRPAVCYRMDLHAALVNDAALAHCDLRLEPAGGRIARDSAGHPTGLFVEAAAWQIVNPVVPAPDAGLKQQALRAAQAHAHAHGLIAVGSMEYGRTVEDVFEPLRDELTLRCHITLLDRDWPIDFSYGEEARQRNDDRLAAIGYKTFIDGTLGSRTARLFHDYADDPGNRGMFVELALDGHLFEWSDLVRRHGFSPSMHAIGDEAVSLALDVVEKQSLYYREGSRTFGRIEHAQQIEPAQSERFNGVVASMQPLHLADDGRYAERRVGRARLAGSFAFRSLLNAGAHLAFGSDWPVVSIDPLAGIRAAMTGLTSDGDQFLRDEVLTFDQALHAYTIGAARALDMPDAGMIRVGQRGDVVLLDRDPYNADWTNDPPRIAMTVVNGDVVYDAR